ncbi:hypothetical protein GCM10010483_69410 [Actinokineospora diospyrosa]
MAQPTWVDEARRTFTFSVASTEVPRPTLLPGQVAGQHVIVVTLPEDYASSIARYPVLYALHGNPDMPNTEWNIRRAEIATQGKPVITVQPNGVRSWYSNWVNPGAVGKQNWENFHLNQVIPLVDANLRTIAGRDGRALLGHSMGGFGALHYAEHRPDLFGYVGSMSGGLDLLNPAIRAAVVGTSLMTESGVPTVGADAIFGPPVWPFDGIWNAESPAQHVRPLRGMGVALYTGNGGNLLDNPVQAVVEQQARETNLVTVANLTAAGVPFDFYDYGDGSGWAPGCTGKHAQAPCLQKAMSHFVGLILGRLQHP